MAVSQFVELINGFDYRPMREQHLRQMGELIQQDKQVALMLVILMRFIEKLEIQPLSWDIFTRDVALTQLQTENQIIDSLFKSIAAYKDTHPVSDTYLDAIKARTDFI